jgi:hypothetical protein
VEFTLGRDVTALADELMNQLVERKA